MPISIRHMRPAHSIDVETGSIPWFKPKPLQQLIAPPTTPASEACRPSHHRRSQKLSNGYHVSLRLDRLLNSSLGDSRLSCNNRGRYHASNRFCVPTTRFPRWLSTNPLQPVNAGSEPQSFHHQRSRIVVKSRMRKKMSKVLVLRQSFIKQIERADKTYDETNQEFPETFQH